MAEMANFDGDVTLDTKAGAVPLLRWEWWKWWLKVRMPGGAEDGTVLYCMLAGSRLELLPLLPLLLLYSLLNLFRLAKAPFLVTMSSMMLFFWPPLRAEVLCAEEDEEEADLFFVSFVE